LKHSLATIYEEIKGDSIRGAQFIDFYSKAGSFGFDIFPFIILEKIGEFK